MYHNQIYLSYILIEEKAPIKGINDDISNEVDKLQADGSASNVSVNVPIDPNLTCPVCRTSFRKGEIKHLSAMLIVVL